MSGAVRKGGGGHHTGVPLSCHPNSYGGGNGLCSALTAGKQSDGSNRRQEHKIAGLVIVHLLFMLVFCLFVLLWDFFLLAAGAGCFLAEHVNCVFM